MNPINEVRLEFVSKSSNESFARVVAAAFVSQIDPIGGTCGCETAVPKP